MSLSADVTPAAHATYPELYDPRNAAFPGSGVAWDQVGVHAEFMAHVSRLLDESGIMHPTFQFGRTRDSWTEDGTILPFLSRLGMRGMNMGIPLLSPPCAFGTP